MRIAISCLFAVAALISLSLHFDDAERGFDHAVLYVQPIEEIRGGSVQHTTFRRGRLRVRRACADGRCDALIGEHGGFAYHLSYPADRRLFVSEGGMVTTQVPPTAPMEWAGIAFASLLAALMALMLEGIRGVRVRAPRPLQGWVDATGALSVYREDGVVEGRALNEVRPGPVSLMRAEPGVASFRTDPRDGYVVTPTEVLHARCARKFSVVKLAIAALVVPIGGVAGGLALARFVVFFHF